MRVLFKKVFLLFLLFVCFVSIFQAQKLKITFQIEDYNNDTIIIGNYFGNKTLVKDTVYSDKKRKGVFIWTQDTVIPQGVYLALLKPQHSYIEFLINGQKQNINFKFSYNDLNNVKVSGCNENLALYKYLAFLQEKRRAADTIKSQMEKIGFDETITDQSKTKLEMLDEEVKNYQNQLIHDFHGSVLALLINLNSEIKIPEFSGSEQSIQNQKFNYYKNHFFDNVNFNHPALIRTPVFHIKVNEYLDKLTVQMPDSIRLEVDRILDLVKSNTESFKYLLSELLSKYGKGDYIGHDDVAVHIIDQYFAKGRATWVTEESLSKLTSDADNIRPTMLNKKFPDITTYTQESKPVRLLDINSDFTIVFIYDPECGTCKKATPYILDFYKKYGHESVKILTICNQGGDKFPTCWTSVKEKGMEQLINTSDEYQRYQQKVRNTKVPKIYILDKEKKVLLKDFAAEKLGEVYENFKNTYNKNIDPDKN